MIPACSLSHSYLLCGVVWSIVGTSGRGALNDSEVMVVMTCGWGGKQWRLTCSSALPPSTGLYFKSSPLSLCFGVLFPSCSLLKSHILPTFFSLYFFLLLFSVPLVQ